MDSAKKSEHSDDIDLLQLLADLIKAIKSNFKIILIFAVVGMALAICYGLMLSSRYKNRMLAQVGVQLTLLDKQLTDNFRTIINDGNYEELSRVFRITPQEARSLISVKIEKVNETICQFTVVSANSDIFPKIQNGIIQHLSNIEYVKTRVEQKKNYLSGMIHQIEGELADLKKKKQDIYNSPISSYSIHRSMNQISDNTQSNYLMMDRMSMYTTASKVIQDLTEKKLEYQNELDLAAEVQLVQGFVKLTKPSVLPLKFLAAIGLFGGFALALMWLGWVAFKRKYLSATSS